ncbi:hypothetical protein ACIP5Y_33145 [Nocardia sp. NPDC088792]|uniref:hypothetical protein n=1 Tax=Nocardia sp. NPDC088792 TaxID=3364332 RepID=UPI0038256E28
MASISLLPIYGELSADRVTYVDIDLETGVWSEVEAGGELVPGRILAAFQGGQVVQKILFSDGTPRNVQYFGVPEPGAALRWHAANYPSVRGEIWQPFAREGSGSCRKGHFTGSNAIVDMVKMEYLDDDLDLISEEYYTPDGRLLERFEYRYDSEKELLETLSYNRHGELIDIESHVDE